MGVNQWPAVVSGVETTRGSFPIVRRVARLILDLWHTGSSLDVYPFIHTLIAGYHSAAQSC